MLDSGKAGPAILDMVWEALRQMSPKLDRMIAEREKVLQLLKEKEEGEVKPLDMVALLFLPDHLKRTAIALLRLEEATADKVAKVTGRARAVESCYLNQLERMRFLKRRRQGRMVYFFSVNKKPEGWFR